MKLFKKFAMVFVAAFVLVLSLASCDKTPEGPTVEDAAKKIILTQDKQTVSGDFQVPSVVKVDGVTFTVTWTSDNAVAKIVDLDANYKKVAIDYLHNTTAEQLVKLTATISDGTNSLEKNFEFKVPQFVVQTIAQYDAMLDGEMTTVHGIVVAKETYDPGYGNTSIYVAAKDGKGGVYAYRLKCTQEQYDNELVIGANVYISGAKKMYNGLREYDGSCTYILESSEITTPTVTDVTDLIKAGTKLSADYQNQLIKFSGLEILKIDDKDDKGRYNITVGEGNNTFVVRVNTYITPKDGDSYKAYEELELTPGMIISASGVCGWYNTAQMHPINANDIVVEGINHGQAMAAELAKSVELEDKYYGIKDIELPLTLKGEDYAGYTATWASSSENVVVDGALATTKLVAADEKVILTVTVKDANGTVKGTAEVTVKLASKEYSTAVVTAPVKDTEYYLALTQTNTNKVFFFTGKMNGFYGATSENSADGVKVKLVEVTGGYNISFEVAGKTQYINAVVSGTFYNFVIEETASTVWTHNAEKNIFETVIGEGEAAVTLNLGTYKTYNTFGVNDPAKEQQVYGQLYSVVEKTDTMRVEECINTIKEILGNESYEKVSTKELALPYRHATLEVTVATGATTLAWDATKNTLTITPLEDETEETITVKVTIGEVTKTVEITITSELLREVDTTGAAALEDGKKVAVTGTVKKIDTAWDGSKMTVTITDGTTDIQAYQLSTQVLEGAKIKVTGAVGSHKGKKQIAKGATAVVLEGPALVSQVKDMPKGADVVVSGTVTKINTAWSDQYNNITVTIADGKNTLYVYRLKTNVAVGDDITVTGKVDFYNGSVQIAAGATAEVELEAAAKVAEVADEIAKLFTEESIPQVTEIKLTSKYEGVTFTVTPQEGATTLAWDAEKNILTVTPAQTEKTETVKVAVALGESKEEATYTIKSLLSTTGLKAKMTINVAKSTNLKDDENQAELFGLNATMFSVVGSKGLQNNNVGLNADGSIRLYADKTAGDGNTLTITATGATITKIIVEFGSKTGAFTVNGVEGSKTVTEYAVNGTSVAIKNVDTTGTQLHFLSITIVYDLAE